MYIFNDTKLKPLRPNNYFYIHFIYLVMKCRSYDHANVLSMEHVNKTNLDENFRNLKDKNCVSWMEI